ncbi:MAG: hypothetical protein ABFD92_03920 [Planctomycetaceae bacterium]|nr:hypothetical protein [Planctomycetaceae bacterium]
MSRDRFSDEFLRMNLVIKAQMYLERKEAKYRQGDARKMPPENWPQSLLRCVRSGMQQIAKGTGFSRETPFVGLGIEGFYALAHTLHLELVRQEAQLHSYPDGGILDSMIMKPLSALLSGEVTLYNRVNHPARR